MTENLAEQLQEIAGLAQIDRLTPMNAAVIRQAADQLQSLRQQVAAMKTALEPFAASADYKTPLWVVVSNGKDSMTKSTNVLHYEAFVAACTIAKTILAQGKL